MKRFLLIISSLVVICGSIEAQDSFVDSLFKSANLEYSQENYHISIDVYSQIADTGFKSFELYYNLGNAYFKVGNYPKSILFYEKAILLDPGNEDVKFNLQKANAYIIDNIEMIPEFFLVSWFQGFISMFKSNSWSVISIVSFIISLVLLVIFLISRSRNRKVLSFTLAIVTLIVTVLTFTFAVKTRNYVENSDRGIVMTSTVTIKGAPDENGVNVFIIHEGTKVSVLRSISDWYEIRIADGKQGWMLKSDLEKI